MTYYCFLDQFPVEILHTLFDYIPALELYSIFYNVSNYIDTVLLSYPICLINFKSFSQYDVDFICHRIKPDQIISLTLSDDIDTNGQLELFFSYFHIEQFIRLQSLTLINIVSSSYEFIFPNLNKLNQLRSFSFIVTENYSTRYEDFKLRFEQLKSIPSNINQLTLYNIEEMTLKSFSRLRRLKSSVRSRIELEKICSELSQLKSFDVYVHGDSEYIINLSSLSKLTRLILNIGPHEHVLSMNLIEQFLPKLSQLKHFEFQTCRVCDFADGQRWENLTQSLTTFDFKIKLLNLFENFNSFRPSFWIEEKHWFVVYDNENLYTIPRFAPTTININNQSSIISNLSNYTIYYQCITKLIVSTKYLNNNYHFPNVKILKINCAVSIERLSNIVNLNQVKHLMLSSHKSLSMFLLMLPIIPLLNELTITGYLVPYLIDELQDNIIQQIRILNISNCYFENESITEILCYLFPCIQYLNISLLNSLNHIGFFIQQFKYLLNASFGINSLLKKDKEKNSQELKMIIDKKYTCQIVHPSKQTNTLSCINIWVTEY